MHGHSFYEHNAHNITQKAAKGGDIYCGAGHGERQIDFGRLPATVSIDFQKTVPDKATDGMQPADPWVVRKQGCDASNQL